MLEAVLEYHIARRKYHRDIPLARTHDYAPTKLTSPQIRSSFCPVRTSQPFSLADLPSAPLLKDSASFLEPLL